jgi:hypothetical protein
MWDAKPETPAIFALFRHQLANGIRRGAMSSQVSTLA